MKSKNKYMALPLAALFVIAEGCTHKDLNDSTPTTIAEQVQVVFDWSKSPDSHPSTMKLYLYSEGRDMMDYWFDDYTGGTFRSYAGDFTSICHSNDDPYGHFLRNQHSHNDFEIYTDNSGVLIGQGISTRGIPRAEGTEEQPLRVTPSRIFGTYDRDIKLKASGLVQTITLFPEELVCHYSVEFVDVENLKSADLRIDGTISSLAGSYFPGRLMPSSEAVSHPFTLTAGDELTSLRSEFLTFGTPDGPDLPHKICVYIALRNRTGNYYTFDVTDQINQAPDPRNVKIVIRGLKLPELPDEPDPPPAEGGMSVEVDTWEAFHFDIKV